MGLQLRVPRRSALPDDQDSDIRADNIERNA
jgi:hypothetical protein